MSKFDAHRAPRIAFYSASRGITRRRPIRATLGLICLLAGGLVVFNGMITTLQQVFDMILRFWGVS